MIESDSSWNPGMTVLCQLWVQQTPEDYSIGTSASRAGMCFGHRLRCFIKPPLVMSRVVHPGVLSHRLVALLEHGRRWKALGSEYRP